MAAQQKALIVYAPHRGFERRDRLQEESGTVFVEREGEDRRKSPRIDFDPLYELNRYLNSGWRVALATPMGGGHYHPSDQRLADSVLSFATLVILEKED